MSYLKDFKRSIANREYPNILKLWEEYCAGDELDAEEVCDILQIIKTSEFAEPFGREVERILPLWKTLGTHPLANTVFRLIVDLATTSSETLNSLAYDYLTTQYGHEKDFADKIKRIGFRNREKLQGVISNYELLSHFAKGNYVFHANGWGVGEIIDVSFLREQLTLEFDSVPGRKELSFATAFKTLSPLPNTHFLSLRFGDPDSLEKKAKEEPLEVIHMLLKDLGPKTASEIKEELCDLVIPAQEWSRWWQTTRAKLKKDTLVLAPEDLKEPFTMRKHGLSHENRMKELFDGKFDTPELIQALYSSLRDFNDAMKDQEVKSIAISKIREAMSLEETTPPHKIELLFLLQDLGEGKDDDQISTIIQKTSSIEQLINLIEIQAFKKKALVETKKERSDWKQLFLDLLFRLDINALKDYLLQELLLAKEEGSLKSRLEELSIHPAKNPGTFLWYFQKLQSQKEIPFSDKAGHIRFFEGLLVLLSAIENKADMKDTVKKILSLLSDGRFALVRSVMQIATMEEVREFILLASKCHSLADHDQKIFHSLGEVVFPALAKAKKKQGDSSEESSVIWTTQQGYEKLKNKIEQIATVEAVANAQEIEAARAHGDLRENAEFKAALEKRDRLQSELKLLSEQLKNARIITEQDVSTQEISVGTIVQCSNKAGKTVIYTLLGPWDADPDKHILSFQSKLAQSMKGKSVGATISIPGDELTILSIRSFFTTQIV